MALLGTVISTSSLAGAWATGACAAAALWRLRSSKMSFIVVVRALASSLVIRLGRVGTSPDAALEGAEVNLTLRVGGSTGARSITSTARFVPLSACAPAVAEAAELKGSTPPAAVGATSDDDAGAAGDNARTTRRAGGEAAGVAAADIAAGLEGATGGAGLTVSATAVGATGLAGEGGPGREPRRALRKTGVVDADPPRENGDTGRSGDSAADELVPRMVCT